MTNPASDFLVNHAKSLEADRDRLRAINAELLAALKDHCPVEFEDSRTTFNLWSRTRDLIARAEGGDA